MTIRSARRGAGLLAIITAGLVGCDTAQTTQPTLTSSSPATLNVVSQVYTSGAHVTTWDPILAVAADPNWPTTVCTSQPLVGPNANWQNQHGAFVLTGHSWANLYFSAPWINARNTFASVGPGGHNWTKYETPVSGNGSFVISLLADNCSWVYLDGTLVGVQPANHSFANTRYGLTLNGTHTLSFIIFDGGGAAGGKFILETTTNPPPPLNPDLDGDGHLNTVDKFPLDPTEWADTDADGKGDNSDAFPTDPAEQKDTDVDGVGDNGDNCRAVANPDQADLDGDAMGDACDPDIDGDGVLNEADAYPNDPTRSSPDGDGDGVNDGADNCPAVSNASQADQDQDGVGDACDPDIDGDGFANGSDAFPTNPAEWADSDGDGVGNNSDAFPTNPAETVDSDGDGVGDNGDNCRLSPNTNQANLDNDSLGDACDPDIDGDGFANGLDVFPRNSAEWADTDGDGVGDNADAFDNSNTGPVLLVGTCNTGVANWHMGGGTWANDLIAALYASAANHGKFVSAVSDLSNGWKNAGKITGREHGAIVSCAAKMK